MVVLLVKSDKIFILEVSDCLRVPARVKSILRLLEEVLIDVLDERFFRVTHRAFHLVEDHTFELKRTFGIVPLLEF